MTTQNPDDGWFEEIFGKSVAVDLRETTGKQGQQPESTMYLWQLKAAIHRHVQQAVLAELKSLRHEQDTAMPIPNFIDLVDYRIAELEQSLKESNHDTP